jgi:glucose/mannose-6-phosphate isomerase
MDKLIQAFPQNILDAIEIAGDVKLKPLTKEVKNILICGMGGSGIGGKIVGQLVEKELKVPISYCQNYQIPAFVDEHTLLIASSYSGNTEETMIAVSKGFEAHAQIIGITSGGDLEEFCIKHQLNCVIVPGGNPPRSAVAYSIVQIINVFVLLGLIDFSNLKKVKDSYQVLVENELNIKKEAQKLADFLKDKVAVFYSDSMYEGIAIRARQQFNENSKLLCWHHVLPEMNHNELVGWGGGTNDFAVVFFITDDTFERTQKRFEISIEKIKEKTDSVIQIVATGSNQFEKSFYLIHLVDWASWYLAELKKVDAMDIKVIDFLKDELSKF